MSAGSDSAGMIAQDLLAWYDGHARILPWRTAPAAHKAGERPDPYRVWLSEIMLQQTTVTAVKPYFQRFFERWPDVRALASADESDIMAAWAGLGYYSRARNLHACARKVVDDFGGSFPQTTAELKTLPGIGDYTSAAIASIAFDEPAPVVDGNIERVVSRLYRIDTPLPAAKTPIRKAVGEITPNDRPGDFAQAMMDLGATICVPKSPSCLLCPIAAHCQAKAKGDQTVLPVKAPKREIPLRKGAAFVGIRASDGAIWLRRRKASGMLGGMVEAPSTDWSAKADGDTGTRAAPFMADWQSAGAIEHGFTHFKLTLTVYRANIDAMPDGDGWFAAADALEAQGLPTLMRKVVARALDADDSLDQATSSKRKRPAPKEQTVSHELEAEPSGSDRLEDEAGSGTRRPARLKRRTRRTSARWSKT